MHRRTHLAPALALALFLAACGGKEATTASTPGVSGDTIYIGALTPLSDPVAVIGKPLLRGIQVYFDQVNASGGIAGKYRVRVLEEDITYANPSTSVQKYQKIKDQVAMFGMILGTDHINGTLPLLREDGIVATPVTLDAEWTRDPNLLPVGAPYHIQVINGIGYFLSQPGNAGKTVCSMVLATGYGEAAEEGLDYAAEQMGFTPGAKTRFRQDDQDFVAPITQLRNAKCDLVVLASLPAVTGKVAGAAAQLGYAPRWLMTSPSWHGALAGSPLADYLSKTAWVAAEGAEWGDTTVAGVREMMAALATHAPDQPADYYYVFGWVAGASIGEHLGKAVAGGDLTREGFLKALEAMGPVSAAGWGEYRYGTVATREPPRSVTILRVNPAKPFGMEVEARNVEVPAAQSYQFTVKP
jgi:ABC-type branched-subunit amino acid transport system substrate-binding protein